MKLLYLQEVEMKQLNFGKFFLQCRIILILSYFRWAISDDFFLIIHISLSYLLSILTKSSFSFNDYYAVLIYSLVTNNYA